MTTSYHSQLICLCHRSKLKLSTISAARSAFCLFTFEPAFFSKYRITAKPRRRGEPSAVQLQILGKTLHDIFKQKAVASAQRITLSISASDFSRAEDLSISNDSSDLIDPSVGPSECRLTITIFCPHGVKKTYRLTYQAAACMVALANREDCSSSVTASPRIVKDWTDHFMLGKQGSDEITFWYTANECRVKSYDSNNNNNNANLENAGGGGRNKKSKEDSLSRQSISTTLNVHTDEFDSYTLGTEEALITVTLKEFKAIIEFGMAISNSVEMHFNRGGEPLLATMDTDSLSIQFVLSTNADDPAGIQREADQKPQQQDIKPRLSQARLTSLAPSQQQGQQSRQGSRANSTTVSNGRHGREVSGTPGPPLRNKSSKPLFQPRDDEDEDGEDEERSRRASTSASSRAAPIPIEDDEEDLWDQADNENPSFSQQAMNLEHELDLDNSLSQVGQPRQDSAGSEEESRLEMEEVQGRPQSTQVKRKQEARRGDGRGMEGMEMSLDEEEGDEDSMMMAEEENSRSKKGKKSWNLGVTL